MASLHKDGLHTLNSYLFCRDLKLTCCSATDAAISVKISSDEMAHEMLWHIVWER